MNQGKWWFTRLNSGRAYVKRGDKYYAIKLCEKGTADLIVIRGVPYLPLCETIFLELKAEKGRQSDVQKEFERLVRAQGVAYYIIRSFEEVEEVLG